VLLLLVLLAAEGVDPARAPVALAACVHWRGAHSAGAGQGGQHNLAVRSLLHRRSGLPAQGPPPVLLRLLGPVVVILTLVLLFSGVGLLLVSRQWLPLLLKVHKASFVLWFGAMTIHVLGHLGEVFRLAPRDWLRRSRREVTGPVPGNG
jgi:hypothetical protein